jgi:hypothetical protein
MALGLTQPLTGIFQEVKGGQHINLTAISEPIV